MRAARCSSATTNTFFKWPPGHADLFAVQPTGTRQHLFRVEAGESILDLHNACETSGSRLQIVAVGAPGTELLEVPRSAASLTTSAIL
jgi:hypothetical protein